MRLADPFFRVFGATYHKYCLGSTLSESELQAFEQNFQVTLPAEYRSFLRDVGNGGIHRSSAPYIAINAGPGPRYGLLPLEEAALECDISQPFPLLPSSDGQPVHETGNWGDAEPYPGVLQISYGGCAYFSFLVVKGPAYGTVWDAEVSLGDFYPTNLSFDEWYRHWIDTLPNILQRLADKRSTE